MLDLVRMVKLEKNRTTIHTSTDLTEDCGGYSSGYIYEIVFADVVYFDKSGRCTEKPDSLECTSHFNTFLVADDKVLSDSNMIALSSKGNEVSFLTTIPYANIKRYKGRRARRGLTCRPDRRRGHSRATRDQASCCDLTEV
jgi:hypothetical protein